MRYIDLEGHTHNILRCVDRYIFMRVFVKYLGDLNYVYVHNAHRPYICDPLGPYNSILNLINYLYQHID